MSISPIISDECATPFKCGGCTGSAYDHVKGEVVDCQHYCHNQGRDREPRLPFPPDDDLSEFLTSSFNKDKGWPQYEEVEKPWKKELVDA
jgi:hypothetical protein